MKNLAKRDEKKQVGNIKLVLGKIGLHFEASDISESALNKVMIWIGCIIIIIVAVPIITILIR